VSIPKDEISVYRQDESSLYRQDESLSGARRFTKFEPIEEEPEDIKILSEDEDVVKPLEVEPETSIYPEFPIALWKVILITILALLWAYGRPSEKVAPGQKFQNEEFEYTEMPESIPMLGTDDSTTTAVAVTVDALSVKGETSSSYGKPTMSNSLGELTFAYADGYEEKWGIFAIITLVMMIL